jgi:DNA replication initiation complex subunit (GINS family)
MDEHEQINYKTLRKLQQAEQSSSLLTKININYYEDLSVYLQTLERSTKDEKNPLKVKLFTEEIQNTKKIATSIYELREKKIVQAALATARGANIDLTNFLEIEKNLYSALIEQIEKTRTNVFSASVKPLGSKQPSASIVSPQKQDVSTEQMKQENNNHPLVQVLEDTPEFIGTDGKPYILQKEDVLTLPNEMCQPLLKKKVVKQIK